MFANWTRSLRTLFSQTPSRRPSPRPRTRRLEFDHLEDRRLLAAAPLAMHIAQQHEAVVADSTGKIYAIGGIDNAGRILNTVEVYDPATNTWTDKKALPTARFDLAATFGPDGKLYVIGGQTTPGHTVATVEVYTPSTDTWTTAAALLSPRDNLAVVSAPDGHIYAIAGHQHISGLPPVDVVLGTVEQYTPLTNTWVAVANMNHARSGLAATLGSDGQIYAFGGGVSQVEVYNTSTNLWTTPTIMPTSRSNFAAVTNVNGVIYTIGGFADVNGKPVTNIEAYAPATNQWMIIPNGLSTPREFVGAALGSDNHIYTVGGYDGTKGLNTIESFTPLAFGTDQNQLFVNQAYIDVLGRPADTSGLFAWTKLLDNHTVPRSAVALLLEVTPEARLRTVNGIYQTLLGRNVDVAGASFMLQLLALGGAYSQVRALIYASDEYYIKRGGNSDVGWLTAMYSDIFGRSVDPGGSNTFMTALKAGISKMNIAFTLMFSQEGLKRQVNGLYQTYLHRDADPTGQQIFVDAFARGAKDEMIIAIILGSNEYFFQH
jgi:N-acetylneuraminic acid mutarotase